MHDVSSMTDRYDIFASKLQEFLQQEGIDLRPWQRDFLVQYICNRDLRADHVDTQDETPETREVGDCVRPEPRLRGLEIGQTFFDEIDDEFIRHISLRFNNHGCVKPIGHAKLTKNPDGSIHASIEYGSTKPQVNGPV